MRSLFNSLKLDVQGQEGAKILDVDKHVGGGLEN